MSFPHKMGFMKPKGPGYCAEYLAVYNAFPNKPSAADAVIQNAKMLAIVASGRYAKGERHWEFSAHSNSAGESQLDWIDPVNHLPVTNVNGCAWDAYNGFTGNNAGSKYLRSNFIPSVDGTLIGQNNICAIIGIGTDLLEATGDFGNTAGTPYLRIYTRFTGNLTYTRCNCSTNKSVACTNSKAYFAISRGVAANYDSYRNLVKTNLIDESTGLPDGEILIGYVNIACNKQLRCAEILSYLTEGEVQSAIGDENIYLTNYSTNLY
jgi:hypothetical protein